MSEVGSDPIGRADRIRVLNLMRPSGLAGLESHQRLKLMFQMHYERTRQTTAQKATLNMDIIIKRVEAKVLDAGEEASVFVDNIGKPSIAMRIAMLDFGTINPLDLVKHTESSTNHNTSGWVSESGGGDQSVNKVGSSVASKGTLDMALNNLRRRNTCSGAYS